MSKKLLSSIAAVAVLLPSVALAAPRPSCTVTVNACVSDLYSGRNISLKGLFTDAGFCDHGVENVTIDVCSNRFYSIRTPSGVDPLAVLRADHC